MYQHDYYSIEKRARYSIFSRILKIRQNNFKQYKNAGLFEKRRYNTSHVCRQFSFDAQLLFAYRMRKGHAAGMQGLPRQDIMISAIEVIAEQRMAEVGKVHTNLMRAPGFQAQFKQAAVPALLQCPVMRDGRAPPGGNHAFNDAARPAGNRQIDHAV